MSTTDLLDIKICTVAFTIAFCVFCENKLSVVDMISWPIVRASSNDEGVWKSTMLMSQCFLNLLTCILFETAKAITGVFEIGISDVFSSVSSFAV